MKRRVVVAFLAMVALALVLGAGFLTYALSQRPAAGEPILFAVRNGEAFSSVKDRLAAAGMIRYPRAIALYAVIKRYDRRVRAGTYRLTPGERPRDILSRLVLGDVYKVAFTIPEGFMHREISGVLAAEADVDSSEFAALLADEQLLADLDIEGPSLEGYLFPDTYLIPWGIGPREIARTMADRLDDVFDDTMSARADELGMSRHQVLTLASIIQAETRLSEELTRVSAVYHNRLQKGMRLEADPTVAYAMDGYRGRLFFRDLEVDSPYNTYKHAGLPPGPICNPGKGAITSALYPDTTCRAVYFVAQGNGGHIFSLTLSDHLAAVRKVREARARE